MDYRVLVKKYMDHVVTCAGTDYVDVLNDPLGSDVEFTDDEQKELDNISIELTHERSG
jgi:hypothetical protein